MGIGVGVRRLTHSADPTGSDINPLQKWFESNRAYQVFVEVNQLQRE